MLVKLYLSGGELDRRWNMRLKWMTSLIPFLEVRSENNIGGGDSAWLVSVIFMGFWVCFSKGRGGVN